MTTGRALLIINPNSRGGQADLDAIKTRLGQSGLGVETVFPENRQSVRQLIEVHKQDCDRVIIGGGDGSLNAAAEALVANTLPLGILPLGTANDLARTLGIPLNPIQACEIIAKGRLHRIDLGCVNGHYFFNVAHIGFGVTLARELSAEIKKQWGILGYGRAAFAALNKRASFRAVIRDNGRTYKKRCFQIAIGNGRHFGGGLAIAHDARIDDHTLDVWSLEPFALWELMVLLPGIRSGRHLGHRRVWHRRTQSIEIRTRKRMPVSADGEETTFTPARFHVLPSAISVYIPPHYELPDAGSREAGQSQPG
ncbi:MAG: lipid kinase [Nitrococcus sp.]|nr:lipid kinase [Nitrococcus sp.]